jgi:hypothetical protein
MGSYLQEGEGSSFGPNGGRTEPPGGGISRLQEREEGKREERRKK